MSHITTVTKHYATCPHCEQNTNSSIDHLLESLKKGKQVNAGPWRCRECGQPFEVHSKDSELIVTKSTSPNAMREIKTWDLVEYFNQNGNLLRLLLDGKRWEKFDTPEDQETIRSNKQYWYDEGTCPTNWTNSIEMMIYGRDTDPHGVFRFLGSVDQTNHDLVIEQGGVNSDEVDVFKLFPEHMTDVEEVDPLVQFLTDVPPILTKLLATGRQVSMILVKGEDKVTPSHYVINVRDKRDQRGPTHTEQHTVQPSPGIIEKYKAI